MGGHGIAGIGDGRITAGGRHTPAAIAMDGDNGLFRLGVDQRSLLAVGFKVCVAIAADGLSAAWHPARTLDFLVPADQPRLRRRNCPLCRSS
jgi:hypothetical protein